MEGEEVEPYLVVALAPNKPKEKNGLEFKKGQNITIERVNKDTSMFYGFYGKKEGWFADYFVKRIDGAPEQRKGAKVIVVSNYCCVVVRINFLMALSIIESGTTTQSKRGSCRRSS